MTQKKSKRKVNKKRGPKPKYTKVKELQAAIDSYFKSDEKKTITGLALHLGFATRKALCGYEERGELGNTIKRAKTRIEQYYEESLLSNHATGAIFALKNFDWRDDRFHNIGGQKGNPLSIPVVMQVENGKTVKKLTASLPANPKTE